MYTYSIFIKIGHKAQTERFELDRTQQALPRQNDEIIIMGN